MLDRITVLSSMEVKAYEVSGAVGSSLAVTSPAPLMKGLPSYILSPVKNLILKFLATQRINIHARFLFLHYW